jgi:hypothetical protein
MPCKKPHGKLHLNNAVTSNNLQRKMLLKTFMKEFYFLCLRNFITLPHFSVNEQNLLSKEIKLPLIPACEVGIPLNLTPQYYKSVFHDQL